ncbi:MAG: multicomponent Na+:H+ antiporter subunit E [Candidatus Azotimanducaceae bacterium]|jgi:multicomponent Na+:H+ antiporter subunit E
MTEVHSKYTLRRKLVLLVLLAATWMLWSGFFKPLLLSLGVFSCLLTYVVVKRMGYFNDQYFALHFSFRLFSYWLWLGREIIRSSVDVARIVLSPSLPISPRVVEIKVTAQHPVDQVILANSITLTPGTLALDLHNGIIKVHALTEAGARDLVSGEMDRRVAQLSKN